MALPESIESVILPTASGLGALADETHALTTQYLLNTGVIHGSSVARYGILRGCYIRQICKCLQMLLVVQLQKDIGKTNLSRKHMDEGPIPEIR